MKAALPRFAGLSKFLRDIEVAMRLGIDIGSTTVKLVLLDNSGEIRYSRYERHMSNVFETVVSLMEDMYAQYPEETVKAVITGSGGLSLSQLLGLLFQVFFSFYHKYLLTKKEKIS